MEISALNQLSLGELYDLCKNDNIKTKAYRVFESRVFKNHYQSVYALIYQQIRNKVKRSTKEVAEEVALTAFRAFFAACKEKRQYKPALLYHIAKMRAIDEFRKPQIYTDEKLVEKPPIKVDSASNKPMDEIYAKLTNFEKLLVEVLIDFPIRSRAALIFINIIVLNEVYYRQKIESIDPSKNYEQLKEELIDQLKKKNIYLEDSIISTKELLVIDHLSNEPDLIKRAIEKIQWEYPEDFKKIVKRMSRVKENYRRRVKGLT